MPVLPSPWPHTERCREDLLTQGVFCETGKISSYFVLCRPGPKTVELFPADVVGGRLPPEEARKYGTCPGGYRCQSTIPIRGHPYFNRRGIVSKIECVAPRYRRHNVQRRQNRKARRDKWEEEYFASLERPAMHAFFPDTAAAAAVFEAERDANDAGPAGTRADQRSLDAENRSLWGDDLTLSSGGASSSTAAPARDSTGSN